MTLSAQIVVAVAVVATVLLVVVWRLIKGDRHPSWRRYRLGVFFERDPDSDDDEPA